MIIDFHAHAFADAIADKALAHLTEYYKVPIPFGGHLGDLLAAGAQARLDAMVLLVAATKPEQVKPANDWLLSVNALAPEQIRTRFRLERPPRLVPFGTYHPRNPRWLEEIRRLRAAGIKGIKIHPEFQGIDLADPALRDFFAEVEKDFTVVFHIGDPRRQANNLSTPTKVAAIARNFPHLRIVAAHMGGLNFWEEAYEVLAGRDLYLDTSSTRKFIPPALFRKLLSRHGAERILFGSDFPLYSPATELRVLESLDWLSPHERAQILGANAAFLLGLKG